MSGQPGIDGHRERVIATRVLKLRDGSAEIDIPIRLFAPQQHTGEGWSCGYEIDWPEGKTARDGWGSDSFQAIILTLQAIGTNIYTRVWQAVFRSAGQRLRLSCAGFFA